MELKILGFRDRVLDYRFQIVAVVANQTLLPMGVTNLLVGGPAFMKHRLVEDGHLDYRFQILGFADCGYTDPIAGAREALFRWKDSNTSRAY